MVIARFRVRGHVITLTHADKFTISKEYRGRRVEFTTFEDYREARIEFFLQQKLAMDKFMGGKES